MTGSVRITVKRLGIASVSNAKRKQRKKSMTLKLTNLKQIDEFLDRTASSYLTDYDILKDMLSHVKTDDHNMSHLGWCLVHFQTDMVNIHKTIKNIQARLREIDAGTTI